MMGRQTDPRAGAHLPGPTVEDFERRHLAERRRLHDEGECAGRNCPYCDFARATGRPRWPTTPTGKPTG